MTPRDPDGPLYLGWEYATPCQDPGPPPRRPVPPQREPMSADWLAAQRREERLINRPLKIIVAVAAGIALALGACVAGGLLRAIVAAPTIAVFLARGRAGRVRDLAGGAGAAGPDRGGAAAGRAVAGGPGEPALRRAGRARQARRPVAAAAVRLRDAETLVRRARPGGHRPGGRRRGHAFRLVGTADHGRRRTAGGRRRGDRHRPVGRRGRGRSGRPVDRGGRRRPRRLGASARPAPP